MKKMILLCAALTLGSLTGHASERKETVRMEAAADTGIRFVCKVTVYQSDYNGGIRSSVMHLVKSGREYGLSTGPVGNLGYLDAAAISKNPNYNPRSSRWEARYTHMAKVSGIPTYFDMPF